MDRESINMEQFYNIAGLTVQMDSFGRTVMQAQPYLCEPAEPDIVIHSDWKKFQENQPHLSDDDSEYMSTGGNFYRQLLNYDGMLLHASAVVVDGWAYLFSAPCGTGKSTHTGLWQQVFGDRAVILNDDKPAIRLENGQWYAYGTPWSGKYDISTNIRAKLAGICFLHRANENTIEPFGGTKAIFSLLEQTIRPGGADQRMKIMILLDKLLTQVPVWQMGCNMDPQAAQVSYKAMSGKRKVDEYEN